MADDTKNATLRAVAQLGTNQVRRAPGLMIAESTLEVAAAASANSTYTMVRIPSDARISGLSRIYFDDLASSGSPTFDIGLKAVNANITTDVDALNDGIDVFTAASNVAVIKDIANYGKKAWEFISGLTTDPGGFFDVTVTILDAATNTGGTATMTLIYSVD
jgi:hypothetical protein